VGQGEEDGVGLGPSRVDGEAGRAEMRVRRRDRLVIAIATDEADDLDVRMPGEKPHELGADVARCADDRDANARAVDRAS
jgi:hypothetical protein